ncbi:hypothetical protein KIS1582_2750 [Cytobacillus firmus]|jgi:hypothetical protein|uniref:Uncharacterized protein n=1 Tax=Cytobacillus firmus TaxID=1399 RepID=A0A800MWC2_CYTFI|nr:hypothetical protein KIS1582_2750 [Cytobacillus firmus]
MLPGYFRYRRHSNQKAGLGVHTAKRKIACIFDDPLPSSAIYSVIIIQAANFAKAAIKKESSCY